MRTVLGLLLSLVMLVTIVAIVRDREHASLLPDARDAIGELVRVPPAGLVGTTTSAAFLLLGAWLLGELLARIRLPRVSGYLLFGIAVGPQLSAMLPGWMPVLVPQEQMQYLGLIDALAISMIALIAGGEIRIDFLRSIMRRILILLACDFGFILVGAVGGLLLMRDRIPFMAGLPASTATMVALLIGTFAVANSPAIVIAMVKETGADGPLARTAVALTIFKDLCLVIVFSALLAAAAGLVPPDPGSAAALAAPADHSLVGSIAWHLLGSIAGGGVIGLVMQALGRRMGDRMDVFIVGAGFFIALLSDALELSPLLVGLAAGFVQANLWPRSSEAFFHAIEDLSLPVYCLFFAVTGAGIELSAVVKLWPVALVFVALRMALTVGAIATGNALAGFAKEGRWLWTALIPQAGVSIALATEIGRTFQSHDWAVPLKSLLLAVVAIHEIIGPPLMRLGLVRSGELKE
ncbi:MAG: cation:proton antiporter [Phycisphaerales bacterium]|nr:cation:proton antiporter [Phycisphaerales bacterium]